MFGENTTIYLEMKGKSRTFANKLFVIYKFVKLWDSTIGKKKSLNSEGLMLSCTIDGVDGTQTHGKDYSDEACIWGVAIPDFFVGKKAEQTLLP